MCSANITQDKIISSRRKNEEDICLLRERVEREALKVEQFESHWPTYVLRL